MCKHNDTVILNVPIPADLSHTGKARWREKPVDRCIAPIVDALNLAGVLTRSSCCGHGKSPGSIVLQDGRELFVSAPRLAFTCDNCGADLTAIELSEASPIVDGVTRLTCPACKAVAEIVDGPDVPVNIANCPTHGLHGDRDECFVCGGPVQQVPMLPLIPIGPPR